MTNSDLFSMIFKEVFNLAIHTNIQDVTNPDVVSKIEGLVDSIVKCYDVAFADPNLPIAEAWREYSSTGKWVEEWMLLRDFCVWFKETQMVKGYVITKGG